MSTREATGGYVSDDMRERKELAAHLKDVDAAWRRVWFENDIERETVEAIRRAVQAEIEASP